MFWLCHDLTNMIEAIEISYILKEFDCFLMLACAETSKAAQIHNGNIYQYLLFHFFSYKGNKTASKFC